MKGIARELVRHDIAAKGARRRAFRKQVSDEVPQPLLRSRDVVTLVQDVASPTSFSRHQRDTLQTPSVVLHASFALLLLLAATALAIYKPRGVTRYGWRRQVTDRTYTDAGRP